MKSHWRTFIRHDCELKWKRTSINNQFVKLSFRSSQFVSCEVSHNRTYDKKTAPNRSQGYPTNIQKNLFHRLKKSKRRAWMAKNTWKVSRKTERGFKMIYYWWKNFWETRNWLQYVSNTNKHGCMRKEAHVNFNFGNCFSLQTPKYINLKTKTVFLTQKSGFYFIVQSGQPYYGPFMGSDRL